MTNGREDANGGGGDGGYHRVQAERDPQSNWEVDLAHKLEDYLLKICSGEILHDSEAHISVNFAEAALLLQGSVQVYSRKVEYLHSLVLRALEFLSHKRQEEQLEGTSDQPQDNPGSRDVGGEESDLYWDLDDIPVEAKNCLCARTDEDSTLKSFVKPPANLVVLEGDCLDGGRGDAGELESYLLATNDLYQGFILLDPCDSVAVHEYLDGDKSGRGHNSAYKGSTARKSIQSPTTCSGGASRKVSARKSHDGKSNRSAFVDCSFNTDKSNIGLDPHVPNMFNDGNSEFDIDDTHSEPSDFNNSDEEDDPWKPLNPHEPGNLKVRPFKKAPKRSGVTSAKHISVLSILFPPARFHGPVSTELRTMWEMQNHAPETRKRRRETDYLPLYEKLRQQLVDDGNQTFNDFLNPKAGNDDDETPTGVPEFDQPDDDIPDFMDEDAIFHSGQPDGNGDNFGVDDPFGYEDANSQANLEDLCRSHLDAILASIAETEKQSELAARVTTWKQKIEKNLDEQEALPEFDIHRYGKRILDKLCLDAEDSSVLSFSDVVKGEEKYDVARSFSALLQLVNNGDVELDRNGVSGSVCFTAENPFHVRLLKNDKKREEAQFRLSKKRVRSPARKASSKSDNENDGTEFPSQPNGKFPVKIGKIGVVRCTPEGKKRRSSRLVESPAIKTSRKSDDVNDGTEFPLQPNGKFPLKVGKMGVMRRTPEGKKRRSSRLVESPARKTSRKSDNENDETEFPSPPNGKFPVKVGKTVVVRRATEDMKRRKSSQSAVLPF